MNRRGFFGLLAAGTAVAVTPQLAELLVPKRTIFLPPKGGWQTTFSTHDLLISMDEFVRRYLKPAMSQIAAQIDADGLDMLRGRQWSTSETTLLIRKPYEFNRIDRIGIDFDLQQA